MKELSKTYDPSREEDIYTRWMDKGYFHATVNTNKKPYTIMIPPPNITDKLHVGHALNATVQDIFIRAKRMQGYEALWLPGTDHAAISTEVQVVKAIAQEGKTKDSMGREAFLERVWQWQEEYSGTIVNQFKKLGTSCDWDRERFTMDPGLSDAVLEAFTRLYNDGKIYRGERLVNWCVNCQTTISDAEVDHEEGEGTLYHFKYPVVDSEEFISFATTRPETMLGDTAIAVHPEDKRFTSLIGKMVTIPMVNRQIPIITDSYVDPKYGTGAVKITPAHDPNDFEIGQRHNLPAINIMNDDGTINAIGGEYESLTRENARTKIIDYMATQGLYIKTETITHAKGTHERCHQIVEPLMKLQWFLKMDELAKPALEAYTSGKLKFNKDRHGKVYQHWLEIIRDWCISRQIWWGHRIPAYYCSHGHITVAKTTPNACTTCGDTTLVQDEDTLDTWFSSALWPFSTLGWPQKTPELDYFYPTNVLATAQEIIFFWVVRMMVMGYEFMGGLPFTDVYIHGTVRDANGVKMSKSLGNGIDPLDVVNKYGADVLRLTFAANSPENDSRFHWERVEFSRNFMNKLWNVSRFVMMNLEDYSGQAEALKTQVGSLQTEDRWILTKLNTLVKEVTDKLDSHDIGLTAQKIIDFIWDEFCDWYVEMVKPRLYANKNGDTSPDALASRKACQATLLNVLTTAIKLLHPISPFITEDIFLALQSQEETIMLSPWPVCDDTFNNRAAEKDIETVKEAVRAIRNIRSEKQVPPAEKITVMIQPIDSHAKALFENSKVLLGFLIGASVVDVHEASNAASAENIAQDIVFAALSAATVYVPLTVDTEKEKARLEKEKKRLTQELARVTGKLGNEGFISKAPANLIAEEREKQTTFTAMLQKVEAELRAL